MKRMNIFKMMTAVLFPVLIFHCGVDPNDKNDSDDQIPLDGRGGGIIAFQSERDGAAQEIYVMNADGSGQTRLTGNSVQDVCPALSMDGQKIAFSSARNGNYEIYVMDIDGQNVQRLTNSAGEDTHPSWSPDGSRIAFASERDGDYEIFVMDADGGNPVKLTDNDYSDEFPIWSPDGSRILFCSRLTGDYGIYAMDAPSSPGKANVVSDIDTVFNGTDYELGARWSPDGSEIVFSKTVNFNTQRDVWLINADGTNPRQLTTNASVDEDACFSPDGQRIVFQSDRNGSYQLFIMNKDGSGQTKIPGSAGDYWPCWAEFSSAKR